MTDYGPRIASRQITLNNRTWNDAREDLQRLVNEMAQLADVTNILLSETRISEGGGTTTVELPGDGDEDAMMLMGA